jgi:hypothetical protein
VVEHPHLGHRPGPPAVAAAPDGGGDVGAEDVAAARKHRMNPLVVLRRLFEGAPWLPATTGP